jgi:hypothetical protein
VVFAIICPHNASRFNLRLTKDVMDGLHPVPSGENARCPFREVRTGAPPRY